MSSYNNFDLYIQPSNYTQDFADIFSGVYHETDLHGGSVSFPIQSGGPDEHMVQTTTPYATVSSPSQPNNHAYPFLSTTQPSLPFPAVYADVETTRNARSRRLRDPEHIPRPRNAFIFFRSYFIDHILPSGAGQQHEISKLAGQAWRKLSKLEREPFVQRAKLERETHKARYPDYVYAGGRAIRRGSLNSVAASPTPDIFPSPNIEPCFKLSFSPSWNLESIHFTENQLHIPENNGFSANFIPEDDFAFPTALSSGSESWLQNFDAYGCEGTPGSAAPSDESIHQFNFLTEGMSPPTVSFPSHAVSTSFDSGVEGNWENHDFSFDIDHLNFSNIYVSH